jgi:uncharacterized protein
MIGIAALALLAGVLIGCIGIGGVLLVPCLSLAGIDVHAAIAASMFSFIFSGAIGLLLYARQGSIIWGSAAWLLAGAAPGAFAGSLLAARTSGQLLLLLIGATVAFAGWRMRRPVRIGNRPINLPPVFLLSIAAAVGTASAITGTGGAVLLVPLLIWWGVPVLTSVGLSQAIQIPIAISASIGNVWSGNFDLALSALLSIGVAGGSVVGARVAHALPTVFLARVVAVALVLIGALVVVRSGYAIATW